MKRRRATGRRSTSPAKRSPPPSGRNRRTTGRIPRLKHPFTGRRLTGILPWLFGVMALAGAGIGIHFGWQAVRDSGRLRVQSVEVLGSARTQWAELEAYTGIHVGDAILALDLDAAALGLRRHPWIVAATVRRRLPDHVTLEVTEHVPQILVSLGEVYVANVQGQLFKQVAASDGVALPVLTGLDRARTAAEPERTAALIRDAIALGAAAAEVETALGRLDELHWDTDLGWSVITLHPSRGRLLVHLGFDPVPRLDTAVAALQRLATLGRVAAVIWADGPLTPHRAQVAFHIHSNTGLPTLIAKVGE